MYSVTQKIKITKQPRGGFLPLKTFEEIDLPSDLELHNASKENVNPALIGIVVDYLTRLFLNNNARKAFNISLKGYEIFCAMANHKLNQKVIDNQLNFLESFVNKKQPFNGASNLTKKAIGTGLSFCCFDIVFRASLPPNIENAKRFSQGQIGDLDYRNIKNMVLRSLQFFEKYGPIIEDGFTFKLGNKNGYSNLVSKGDGDFLTSDTLWDFKVTKTTPKIKDTLQLLMYFLMGKKSQIQVFDNIEKIGFYNPRLNKVYLYNVKKLDKAIIKEICNQVIGYNDNWYWKPN